MHEPIVYEFDIWISKSCCVEMTGQELEKPVVRGYDVVHMLLSFRKEWLVSRSELLLAIKRVRMASYN